MESVLEEWRQIQEKFRTEVIVQDTEEWASDFSKLKYAAGLDISTPKEAHSANTTEAIAAITIFDFHANEIVHEKVETVQLKNPYVPGFLAFREAPALTELVSKVLIENLNLRPDVILVDGNGLLHPQRCGLACHIGLQTQIPTIGIAKNLHLLEGIEITKDTLQALRARGDFIYLKMKTDEILGMALKTSDETKNPIFLSIGHKINLETARKVVLGLSKYRVPEPIRTADHISREVIRKMGLTTKEC